MNWTGGSRSKYFSRRPSQKLEQQQRQYFEQCRMQRMKARSKMDTKEYLVNKYVMDPEKKRRILEQVSAEPMSRTEGGKSNQVEGNVVSLGLVLKKHKVSSNTTTSQMSTTTETAGLTTMPNIMANLSMKDTGRQLTMQESISCSDEPTNQNTTSTVPAERDITALMMSVEHCHTRVDCLESTVKELVQYLFTS
jgi:hypothetical protein